MWREGSGSQRAFSAVGSRGCHPCVEDEDPSWRIETYATVCTAMSVHGGKEPRSLGLVVDWGLNGRERDNLEMDDGGTVRGTGSHGGASCVWKGSVGPVASEVLGDFRRGEDWPSGGLWCVRSKPGTQDVLPP